MWRFRARRAPGDELAPGCPVRHRCGSRADRGWRQHLAMRKSHATASSRPLPRAWPSIAAMDGCGRLESRCHMSNSNLVRSSATPSWSCSLASSRRSEPAQKVRGRPLRMTMLRMSVRASSSPSRPYSACFDVASKALTGGRESVMTPMPPGRSSQSIIELTAAPGRSVRKVRPCTRRCATGPRAVEPRRSGQGHSRRVGRGSGERPALRC